MGLRGKIYIFFLLRSRKLIANFAATNCHYLTTTTNTIALCKNSFADLFHLRFCPAPIPVVAPVFLLTLPSLLPLLRLFMLPSMHIFTACRGIWALPSFLLLVALLLLLFYKLRHPYKSQVMSSLSL